MLGKKILHLTKKRYLCLTKMNHSVRKEHKNAINMTQKADIKLFEHKKVRTVWDEDKEEWYFSIVDVIGILTDSPNPRKYWSVLKTRLKQEGSELTTICSQLKLPAADGKSKPPL
jgi:hypothetical protein